MRGVADYHLESQLGFDTPEDVLQHVVETEPLTAPLEAYDRVAGTGEGVSFRYRQAGEEHHTWEFIERDGEWVLRARNGCLPR